MRSALSHQTIEMLFVLWSDLSDAAWCESGLMILTIKQLLMSRLNEGKIVPSLRAKHLLRGIEAPKRRAGIRAGIKGTAEDVSGGDSLMTFNAQRSAFNVRRSAAFSSPRLPASGFPEVRWEDQFLTAVSSVRTLGKEEAPLEGKYFRFAAFFRGAIGT
jgi:hypothetical protein